MLLVPHLGAIHIHHQAEGIVNLQYFVGLDLPAGDDGHGVLPIGQDATDADGIRAVLVPLARHDLEVLGLDGCHRLGLDLRLDLLGLREFPRLFIRGHGDHFGLGHLDGTLGCILIRDDHQDGLPLSLGLKANTLAQAKDHTANHAARLLELGSGDAAHARIIDFNRLCGRLRQIRMDQVNHQAVRVLELEHRERRRFLGAQEYLGTGTAFLYL